MGPYEVVTIEVRSVEEVWLITSCINFFATGRISLDNVALNIMTCLPCGVLRNISCTSLLMSTNRKKQNGEIKFDFLETRSIFWAKLYEHIVSSG